MFEKFRNKIASSFNWLADKFKIDEKKLDFDDLKEVYDMITEFISGGDDGIINAADAILLLNRLRELIAKNKIIV